MMRIRQHFEAPMPVDLVKTVRSELAKLQLGSQIRSGQSVAITVGSRGITNISPIIKTLAEELKSMGARPFVVPAMGSHGSATAEGQRAIVESYGVTEEYLGAPIKSSMEVVQVGSIEGEIPVFFDRYAYEADHVAVVGRVKPHTEFSGEIESGLHKMMLIGLGNHRGATVYHKAFTHYSFDHIVKTVGKAVIEKCNILLGLGIVENQYDETALIRAVAPEDMMQEEKKLLLKAKQWIPRLPFQKADLLIVDQMGKEISGSGMDTNVIGRKGSQPSPRESFLPQVTRVYVRNLTDESRGNGTGLGMVDFTHSQLVKKLDHRATYVNCLTVNAPEAASIPIHFDTDKMVIEAALQTIGYVEPGNAKIIHIRNTLDLKEVKVSEAYHEEVRKREDLELVSSLQPMLFDVHNNLEDIQIDQGG
jgi:hypothetical protein